MIIRLLHKSPNNSPSKDDKIILRKAVATNGESVDVSYWDGKSEIKQQLSLPKSEVPRYIRQILILLAKDIDPFESVQLMFPAYPAVMIPVKSLCQPLLHSTIMDAMRTVLMGWFYKKPLDLDDVHEEGGVYDDHDETLSIGNESRHDMEAPVVPLPVDHHSESDVELLGYNQPIPRSGYLWGGNDTGI